MIIMVKHNSIWHGIGFGMLLSIVVSTLIGWLGIGQGIISYLALYLLCYIPAGFLVGYLNPNHPYTLAAIAGVILSVLNQIVTIIIAPGILLTPLVLNTGILLGLVTTIIGATLSVIYSKKVVKGDKACI